MCLCWPFKGKHIYCYLEEIDLIALEAFLGLNMEFLLSRWLRFSQDCQIRNGQEIFKADSTWKPLWPPLQLITELHSSWLWSAALHVRRRNSRNLDCNPQVSWLRSKLTNHQRQPVVFAWLLRVQLFDSLLNLQNKMVPLVTGIPGGKWGNNIMQPVLRTAGCSGAPSCSKDKVGFHSPKPHILCFMHKRSSCAPERFLQ